ncbi:unnamed protein product [Allacma fusca]|uniref:Uncharacterized protein n=1 Tax=Allacma fusca TaxID=39272 RepID=A0A8J2LCF0_9HEXA|nr:unnamed protein product [Allacma fusca]
MGLPPSYSSKKMSHKMFHLVKNNSKFFSARSGKNKVLSSRLKQVVLDVAIFEEGEENFIPRPSLESLKSHPGLKLITKKDFRINFKILRIFSALGLIPVEIDPETWNIRWHRSALRRWLNNFYLMIWVLHSALCSVRLLSFFYFKFGSGKGGTLDDIPCPILCILASGLAFYTNYIFFWSENRNFNLNGYNEGLNLYRDGCRTMPWSRYSRQDVLLVILVPILLVVPAFHMGIFLTEPTGFNFVYNYIPNFLHDSTLWFIVCALTEFFIVLIWVSPAMLAQLGEMSTFICFDAYLRCAILDIRTQSVMQPSIGAKVRRGYRILREFQMYMQDLNIMTQGVLFVAKETLLISSIILGFFGIRFMHKNWIMGGLFLGIFFAVFIVYPIVNERAFLIPTLTKMYKHEISICALGLPPGRRKRILKSVHAVQHVGVKVGSFGALDRFSVFCFLQFVIARIADLLVSFP